MIAHHLRRECLVLSDPLLNLVAVVPVVGKSSVDITACQLRILFEDLIDRFPELHMPDRDVLNPDAMADDPCLRSTRALHDLDVLLDRRYDRGHATSPSWMLRTQC